MHAHLGNITDVLPRFGSLCRVARGSARYQFPDWAYHVAAVPRVHGALVCHERCA